MKASFEYGKSGPSEKHLLYMDDLKLFSKPEKQLDTLIRYEFPVKTLGWNLEEVNAVFCYEERETFSKGIEISTG